MTEDIRTVYYLTHKDTGLRLKWYKTLQGARIAQRQRNNRLGFLTRIQRVYQEDCELELCLTVDGTEAVATYTIVEDVIETVDLRV
jgi:hypothetical protein